MIIGYPSSNTVEGQLERITTCCNNINEDNISSPLDLRQITVALPSVTVGRSYDEKGFVNPVGAVIDFAGSIAPVGWLFCQGADVSRTTYADLFATIGTTFGVGDGSTTFTLPDTRDRVTAGAGTSYAVADTFGTADHTLITNELASHNHTQDSHNHTQDSHSHDGLRWQASMHAGAGGGDFLVTLGGADARTNKTKDTTATNQAATATNQATGGGAAHENRQPSIAFNKIIKY